MYIVLIIFIVLLYIIFSLVKNNNEAKKSRDYLEKQCDMLRIEAKNVADELSRCKKENDLLRIKPRNINATTNAFTSVFLSNTLIGEAINLDNHNIEQSKRIVNALNEDISITPKNDLSFIVESISGNTYTTTLNSCTCPDFTHRHIPCKHMYRIAIELGQLCSLSKDFNKTNYIKFLEDKVAIEQQYKIVTDKKQTFPFLARLIADSEALKMSQDEYELRNRTRAAMKAADFIAEYRKKNTALIRENKCLSTQLKFLESTFPWLDEFLLISPEEAYSISKETVETSNEFEYLSRWISAEEWKKLSTTERYQIILDRYKERNRSSWEAGRDYERYVGYRYESQGFKVQYFGATQGYEDLGRDVIASNKEVTYIIQCKYWREERTVHEKHIFQLYGTLILYRLNHPESKNVQGLFVTSCSLSNTAKQVANYLNIIVRENLEYKDYPMIKCNISETTGEKIYHLPCDLQYDKVIIEPEKGERYASTVAEAESYGFRRALKWHS